MNPKIKELKVRAPYAPMSNMEVDSKGELKDDLSGRAYFCVWGTKDTYGTSWVRGCFDKSFQDKGPHSGSKQKIVMCWQHRMDDPIAQITDWGQDDYGAWVDFHFDDPDSVPNSKRAIAQIRSGTINQYSFGFDYIYDQMEYDEASDTIFIKEAKLHEISPVTRASIRETYTVRSESDWETEMLKLTEDTEDFIRSLPKSSQRECRKIIDLHNSLKDLKPLDLDKKTLDVREPEAIDQEQKPNLKNILKVI